MEKLTRSRSSSRSSGRMTVTSRVMARTPLPTTTMIWTRCHQITTSSTKITVAVCSTLKSTRSLCPPSTTISAYTRRQPCRTPKWVPLSKKATPQPTATNNLSFKKSCLFLVRKHRRIIHNFQRMVGVIWMHSLRMRASNF